MGNHYIPRFYLKGFEITGKTGWIFTFLTTSNRHFCIKIGNIAQERNFYSRLTEAELNENFEKPANKVLQKFRNLLPITLDEKAIIATYISVLIKRVPKAYQRTRDRHLLEFRNYFEMVDHKLDELDLSTPKEKENYERRKKEVGIIRRDEDKYFREVWEQIIYPDKTPAMVPAIRDMKWLFLFSEKSVFITNDNPIFIFEKIGTRHPASEISCPISSKVALLAIHQNVHDLSFHNASNRIINEINHRTIYNATRYIFSATEEKWLEKCLQGSPRAPEFIKLPTSYY